MAKLTFGTVNNTKLEFFSTTYFMIPMDDDGMQAEERCSEERNYLK
jgi:hypothetical protein